MKVYFLSENPFSIKNNELMKEFTAKFFFQNYVSINNNFY